MPRRLIFGAILIVIFWFVAWTQLGPFSEYYFFPLWLGYILVVDGLVERLSGTSLWVRSRRRFAGLFVISIPFWWIFEAVNIRLQNWNYVVPENQSTLEYVLASSIAFSTVVPAVLITVELLAHFRIGNRLPSLPALRVGSVGLVLLHVGGLTMLVLVLLFPRYLFPLVWLSVFFIIEPLNKAFNQRSLSQFTAEGNWTPVYNVMLGATVTGFFWEMWNIFAFPKWTYDIPYVDVFHVFEMPILGYFGYMPFGLEIVAITAFVFLLIGQAPQQYLRLEQSTDNN